VKIADERIHVGPINFALLDKEENMDGETFSETAVRDSGTMLCCPPEA